MLGGYVISLLSASYSGLLDSFLGERLQFYHKAITWCFCPANSFIVAMIYIVIGKILAENNWENWWISKPRIKTALLYVFVALLGIVEIHVLRWSVLVNDAWVFLPSLTLLGFILLLQTDINIKPTVARWMRNVSILVYILHSIFQYANIRLLHLGNGPQMFIITLTESILFSSIIILLSKRIKYLKKLY